MTLEHFPRRVLFCLELCLPCEADPCKGLLEHIVLADDWTGWLGTVVIPVPAEHYCSAG